MDADEQGTGDDGVPDVELLDAPDAGDRTGVLVVQPVPCIDLQPLKYILSWEKKKNQMIFPCLAWAGYLTEWNGPGAGERPAAYIIITGDTTITDNFWCDHGIAAQSILLGAREMGLAGCMIGAFNEKKLRADLAIPDHLILLLVIALGKPKEQVVIEEVGPDNDIRYWRDESGIHHVPKRKLEDIIVVSGNP